MNAFAVEVGRLENTATAIEKGDGGTRLMSPARSTQPTDDDDEANTSHVLAYTSVQVQDDEPHAHVVQQAEAQDPYTSHTPSPSLLEGARKTKTAQWAVVVDNDDDFARIVPPFHHSQYSHSHQGLDCLSVFSEVDDPLASPLTSHISTRT
jgi:hypothetical protein